MAKVITFSTTFPAYHPEAGQKTYFAEKFLESIYKIDFSGPKATNARESIIEENDTITCLLGARGKGKSFYLPEKKFHTIRSGKRFKEGEYFSPRIWSGKPYNSKQIIIAPDTKIEKIWDIIIQPSIGRMLPGDYEYDIIINHKYYNSSSETINKLAQNDGLSLSDFINWFLLSPDFKKKKSFTGQIICWNNNTNY